MQKNSNKLIGVLLVAVATVTGCSSLSAYPQDGAPGTASKKATVSASSSIPSELTRDKPDPVSPAARRVTLNKAKKTAAKKRAAVKRNATTKKKAAPQRPVAQKRRSAAHGRIAKAAAPHRRAATPARLAGKAVKPTPAKRRNFTKPAAVATKQAVPVRPKLAGGAGRNRPQQGSSFQIMLGGFDPSPNATVYEIDGANTTREQVMALRSRGIYPVCYFSAGTWEEWRPDAARFSPSLLGNSLPEWPGERWLDIRQADQLRPIMEERINQCAAKGFLGIEADNVDGWQNDTGHQLSGDQQLNYIRTLVSLAHSKGLAFGLKNNAAQVPQLASAIDFAVVEQCHEWNECHAWAPVLQASKPVFVVEYQEGAMANCTSDPAGMTTILKAADLKSAWVRTCPGRG